MRNAVLLLFVLFGTAALANVYLNNRIITAFGFSRVSSRIAETSFFSFLPRWFLNKAAVPISREHNASVLNSAYEVFNPSLRSFLTSVPIILDSSANTAKAYPAKGYIGVSPDWDKTVRQSRYRVIYEERGMKPEDPVFIPRFKTGLLIHEFLHILQVHQGVDSHLCYDVIGRWYKDPGYGRPSPNGIVYAGSKDRRRDVLVINRMKYVLWHELYNYRRLSDVPSDKNWENMQYGERYRSAEKGVEEFAYVGQEILASGSNSEHFIKTGQWCDKDWRSKKMRLKEVSPEVIALFRGIFNPELMQ
jgi:hypothetical protein